jgi:hypothetical protein
VPLLPREDQESDVPPLLRLHGLGASVDLQCSGDRADLLASHLRDAWSRCLVELKREPTDAVPTGPPVEARLDGDADLAHQLMATTQAVTRALITAQVGRLLMLHAGAVSHPTTGATLVYVAPGGTGKTTLSRLLGQRFGYVTDETVGIDEGLNILPYPKPLSIRPPEGGTKDEVSPDRLGLSAVAAAPHATRVILLGRQASHGSAPEIEELTLMDAVFALVEQTSSLTQLERPLQRLGDLIERCGPVLRVRYTEGAEVADELAQLIGGSA